MNWREYIEEDPAIMMGKPVIRGTRLTVQRILEKMGNGASIEELLSSYPFLKREDIQAAQAFAADYLGFDQSIWIHRKQM